MDKMSKMIVQNGFSVSGGMVLLFVVNLLSMKFEGFAQLSFDQTLQLGYLIELSALASFVGYKFPNIRENVEYICSNSKGIETATKCLERREMANSFAGSLETNEDLVRQLRTLLLEFDDVNGDPKYLVRHFAELRDQCVKSGHLMGVIFSKAKWNYHVGIAAQSAWYRRW